MLARKSALVLVPLLLVAAPALLPRVKSPGCEHLAPRPESFGEAAPLHALPVAFVPNLGQWKHPARYVARFGAMTMFLEDDGWSFTLVERSRENESTRGVGVRMTFVGAGTGEIATGRRLPGRHHYFLGDDPSRWRSDVPLYESVRYREIHPGVDVIAREHEGRFEFDLVLAPGAQLESVEIAVDGVEGTRVVDDGALVLETALGPVRMPVPPSWEEGPGGEKRPIACRYVLRGENHFGFEAPERRPGWVLVVDPGLIWSTFLGGTLSESTGAIAVDAQGRVTVAGSTKSANFPTTPGAFDTTHNGPNYETDAFITRLSSDASKLIWSTFVGGRGGEGVASLVLDGRGIATFAGFTASDNWPTTSGAFDRTYNGRAPMAVMDGYVARLSPDGKTLIWSTYLGGSGNDQGLSVVLDAQGTATVCGYSGSANFPATPGAFDTTFNGGLDGFVTRIDPSKTGTAQLLWSTFLGGTGSYDVAASLVLDAQGAATVAGGTTSSDFPTTPGAFDRTKGGVTDGFVARLSATGSSLLWSTFLGGSRYDDVQSVALDAGGVVTVTGMTRAPDFPTTSGAFDTVHNGDYDGFVAGLDPTKTGNAQLVWSTFLGGTGVDLPRGLTVDAQGAVTVVGRTGSSGFPTTLGAFDTTYNGGGDAFVTRLSPNGSGLVYSTFLGGTLLEFVGAMAVDAQGAATVAGGTGSTDFPTTPGAFDTTYKPGGDVFVTRLDMLPTGVSAYGASSPGCKGPLAISVTSMPRVGNAAFSITCGNAPPSGPGFLAFSLARPTTPLRWLGIDIWVDVAPSRLFLLPVKSRPSGVVEVPLPIPGDLKLVGGKVYSQFVWAGPNSPGPCPPLGLSASNALSITIQP